MCAKESDAHEYMEWMHSRSQFEDLPIKVHSYHEHVFLVKQSNTVGNS